MKEILIRLVLLEKATNVVEQHLFAKIKKIKLFFSKHKKILISEVG